MSINKEVFMAEVPDKTNRILVVEDEEIVRDSLRDWLTDAGYHVDTVEDGEKAIATLNSREFKLIIVDLRLPGNDGLEVLRQAKAIQEELKGIVITAYPSVQSAVEVMKEGAVDYIVKPYNLNALEESIQKALGPVQAEIKSKDQDKIIIEPDIPLSVPESIRSENSSSALIQMLLAIQAQNNYLPEDALIWVSRQLAVPLTQIYNIATFYKAFSLKPQGRHLVSVCMGTACHVRGAPRLLDKVTETLQINPGETTRDLQFSLTTVNCLGCCALGPVMMIDDKYYSDPSIDELKELFESLRQEKEVV
jgi:NADH-quinone oxidoreductase subunit E